MAEIPTAQPEENGHSDLIALEGKEWIAETGLVKIDHPLLVTQRIAGALAVASSRLRAASAAFEWAFGSFGGVLDITVLAGARSLEDNAVIVPTVNLMGWVVQRLSYRDQDCNPYGSGHRYSGVTRCACLNSPLAHMDRQSVDVAIIRDDGELYLPYLCYRTMTPIKEQLHISSIQEMAARDLLTNAMAYAGFVAPESERPWHFEHKPD